MTLGRLSVLVAAVVGLASTACASKRPPVPYPIDPDPSKSYCLVWVSPTYRDVPNLVKCNDGCVEVKPAWRRDIVLEEVCTPGPVVKACQPDSCREHQVVQTVPPHTEWEKVCCPGPDSGCCYRPVQVPGTQVVCEKTVTEEGIKYCYRKPPQYDVVARETRTCVPMADYGPEAIRAAVRFLAQAHPGDAATIAYRLADTVSPHGPVSRAVLETDTRGWLTGIQERHDLTPAHSRLLPSSTAVSMNCWAFVPGVLPSLATEFGAFLETHGRSLTAECPLPESLGRLVARGIVRIRVIAEGRGWLGVTYPADRAAVAAALAQR